MSQVRVHLREVRERLGGRKVTILGVTKGQTPEKVQEALDAGLMDFGNNYAQEGEALRAAIPHGRWHFIGHIQSRKVKYLLTYDCIQSLDRLEIVADLHSRLEKQDRTIEGLVEVNLAEEASKSGIAPDQVDEFVRSAKAYPRVKLRGLMVLPPPLFPIEERRPYFQRAKAIFDRFNASGWDTLSMGTSEDFPVAIEEGATMIRLGTVLFGPRT